MEPEKASQMALLNPMGSSLAAMMEQGYPTALPTVLTMGKMKVATTVQQREL